MESLKIKSNHYKVSEILFAGDILNPTVFFNEICVIIFIYISAQCEHLNIFYFSFPLFFSNIYFISLSLDIYRLFIIYLRCII